MQSFASTDKLPKSVSRWGKFPHFAAIASALMFVMALYSPVVASEPRKTTTQRELISNSIGMKFVEIPAGKFRMGSPESEVGSRIDERPVHDVEISRPFLLGIYEVTQAEYERVTGTNPSYFSAASEGAPKVAGMATDRFPVESVSFVQADEYCKKLSALPNEMKAGRTYRLPTEAEWQYACRAGSTTPFHYGAALSSKDANINGNFPYGGAPRGPYLGRTTRVGSYTPNAFGLFDMHGNVTEIVGDSYGRFYYAESPGVDPKGPDRPGDRLVLGGNWGSAGTQCRSGFRRSIAMVGAARYFGFRVVCDPNSKEPAGK